MVEQAAFEKRKSFYARAAENIDGRHSGARGAFTSDVLTVVKRANTFTNCGRGAAAKDVMESRCGE